MNKHSLMIAIACAVGLIALMTLDGSHQPTKIKAKTSNLKIERPDTGSPPTPIGDSVPPAPSAFSEIKEPPQAAPSVDVSKYVFAVRAGESTGCAVAIAPDTLLTCWHIVSAYNTAYVNIDGQWKIADRSPIQNVNDGNRDGAILKLRGGGSLPSMKIRPPKYMETATVYGLKTKAPMSGVVSASRTVSLQASEQGVDKGDSGGAVIADDGSLVGIISGYDGAIGSTDSPVDQRVVKITRADLFNVNSGFSASQFSSPQQTAFPELQPGYQPQQPQFQQQQPQMQVFCRKGRCYMQMIQPQSGFAQAQQPPSGQVYYFKQTPHKTTIRTF